jgi:hypothetical protein
MMYFLKNYSLGYRGHPRKFTVDGDMDGRDKKDCFYIDPGEANKKDLIPSIEKGHNIMYYGMSTGIPHYRTKGRWKNYKHQSCS